MPSPDPSSIFVIKRVERTEKANGPAYKVSARSILPSEIAPGDEATYRRIDFETSADVTLCKYLSKHPNGSLSFYGASIEDALRSVGYDADLDTTALD